MFSLKCLTVGAGACLGLLGFSPLGLSFSIRIDWLPYIVVSTLIQESESGSHKASLRSSLWNNIVFCYILLVEAVHKDSLRFKVVWSRLHLWMGGERKGFILSNVSYASWNGKSYGHYKYTTCFLKSLPVFSFYKLHTDFSKLLNLEKE